MRQSITNRKPTSATKRKPAPSPTPSPTPKPRGQIQHVVIIFKDNHAFDNYFGRFPGADGDPNLATASDPPSADHPHDHASWLKPATGAARDQYGHPDIPNYLRYAQQYALGDKYGTPVAGPL